MAPIFMCISSALYTQFTAFSTPTSHWIGFQIIQGVGAGFGMQMSSLAVQLELMDSPDLVPVGITLVTFTQYLGSTVLQVIAGTIFNNDLVKQLREHAGLTAGQTSLLIGGGTTKVRQITAENFPELLHPILESYNKAITSIFVRRLIFFFSAVIGESVKLEILTITRVFLKFVPIAATAAAFFIAFGIRWNRIPDTESLRTEAETTKAGPEMRVDR